MNLRWATILLCCAPLVGACAMPGLPATGMVAVRSSSGQFVVYGSQTQGQPAARLTAALGTNLVRLEPALVAVSCERIKQALLWQLGAPDNWRDKFYIVLHAAAPPNGPIQVTSARVAGGWRYRMDSPASIEPDRFVRAIVRLLLVERINRFNLGDIVDAPAWASEGLAELMLERSPLELLVPPPSSRTTGLRATTIVRQGWLTNHMVKAHQFLRAHEPLGLDALLAPTQAVLLADAALAFRYSSQLLVAELLQLPAGQLALGRFLDGLAAGPDAKSVLLQAFSHCFRNTNDIVKWWELKTYHFTSRDLRTQTLEIDVALKKLDEALRTPVLSRADTNNPANLAGLSLQSLIRNGWGRAWLRHALQLKLVQLQGLQLRVPRELASLVAEYQKVVQAALRPAQATTRGARSTAQTALRDRLISRLNALDAQRTVLQQKLLRPGSATTPSTTRVPPG
ncbi:MAG: hypothetical protein NZ739_02110 [Verrucomicrobiae bacterium]|nr:hypothetical protein [Verrucomicrobiae bacterium]